MAQWVKTDLPEPVIRELEVLIRMAQALMGQPEKAQAPQEHIELGQYPGKVIGSLRRRALYGGEDQPSDHD